MATKPVHRAGLERLTVAHLINKLACILWKPKFHYRFHKSLLRLRILDQKNVEYSDPTP